MTKRYFCFGIPRKGGREPSALAAGLEAGRFNLLAVLPMLMVILTHHSNHSFSNANDIVGWDATN